MLFKMNYTFLITLLANPGEYMTDGLYWQWEETFICKGKYLFRTGVYQITLVCLFLMLIFAKWASSRGKFYKFAVNLQIKQAFMLVSFWDQTDSRYELTSFFDQAVRLLSTSLLSSSLGYILSFYFFLSWVRTICCLEISICSCVQIIT